MGDSLKDPCSHRKENGVDIAGCKTQIPAGLSPPFPTSMTPSIGLFTQSGFFLMASTKDLAALGLCIEVALCRR